MGLKYGTYLPEKHFRFVHFAKEMESLPKVWEAYRGRIAKGATEKEALYYARKQVRPNGDDELYPSVGANTYWDLNVDGIRDVPLFLDFIIGEFLHPFRLFLRPYNASANTMNPVRLLELWQKMSKRDDDLGRQASYEAQRNFILGSQLTLIEMFDPDIKISEDMVDIDRLSQERLFENDSHTLHAIFLLDCDKNSRLDGKVHLVADKNEAAVVRAEMERKMGKNQRLVSEPYPCRVIIQRDEQGQPATTYYVLNDDRRKRRFSRLMKYERENRRAEDGKYRAVRDSRGMLYILVAVQDQAGIRVANRKDAGVVFELVQERMWSRRPLEVSSIPPTLGKRHRHPDYWDVKLIGVYTRDEPDRYVQVSVEQKVTTIADRINEQYATDDLNHGIRRGEQLLEHIDSYFPKDIYDVDWGSGQVRERLRAYWEERHSL